jgi:hypothetical protein
VVKLGGKTSLQEEAREEARERGGVMPVPLLGRLHMVCQSEQLDPDVNEQHLYQAPKHVLPIAAAIDRM